MRYSNADRDIDALVYQRYLACIAQQRSGLFYLFSQPCQFLGITIEPDIRGLGRKNARQFTRSSAYIKHNPFRGVSKVPCKPPIYAITSCQFLNCIVHPRNRNDTMKKVCEHVQISGDFRNQHTLTPNLRRYTSLPPIHYGRTTGSVSGSPPLVINHATPSCTSVMLSDKWP